MVAILKKLEYHRNHTVFQSNLTFLITGWGTQGKSIKCVENILKGGCFRISKLNFRDQRQHRKWCLNLQEKLIIYIRSFQPLPRFICLKQKRKQIECPTLPTYSNKIWV